MKKYLEIFSVIFLAMLISIGSSGVSLYKMTCFSSGKVVRSLEMDFCCSADDIPLKQAAVSSSCCDYSATDFKINNLLSHKTVVQLVAPFVATFTWTIPLPQSEFIAQQWIFEIPPLPATERLAKLCKLII